MSPNLQRVIPVTMPGTGWHGLVFVYWNPSDTENDGYTPILMRTHRRR